MKNSENQASAAGSYNIILCTQTQSAELCQHYRTVLRSWREKTSDQDLLDELTEEAMKMTDHIENMSYGILLTKEDRTTIRGNMKHYFKLASVHNLNEIKDFATE